MTIHRIALQDASLGPLMSVQLKRPILPAPHGAAPPPPRSVTCRALLDTGSIFNMITPQVVNALELQTQYQTMFEFPLLNGTVMRTLLFTVTTTIFDGDSRRSHDLQYAMLPANFAQFDLVLGRSLMQDWHLILDFGGGAVTICQ